MVRVPKEWPPVNESSSDTDLPFLAHAVSAAFA